jgi:hypothetical protein
VKNFVSLTFNGTLQRLKKALTELKASIDRAFEKRAVACRSNKPNHGQGLRITGQDGNQPAVHIRESL